MHVNRLRGGQREEQGSPADLVGRGATPRESVPLPRIQQAATDPDNPGGGPESFDPASTDYKAFGWGGGKTVPSLAVILKDGTECAINYADLATAPLPGGSVFLPSAPGRSGNVIRLRVAGDDGPFWLELEGPRLRRVWELILAHKTPWIRELPAGMAVGGEAEPVIRSVRFDQKKAAAQR